jgi:GT2 family glycosyltransferase
VSPIVRTSVILVAYGRREVTQACLESLQDALGPALGREVEVVVVDNASPDDTLMLLEAWKDRVTVVALEENRNFSGGCNAGAAVARGEVLLFLNNDTIVGPGAIEALTQAALEPGVGAVGCRLLYPDGTIQHAGVWMCPEPTGVVVPYHLFHHEAGDLPAARVVCDLDVVTAACLAIRAELFASVGGFDEVYRNGWEDVDLCLKVRVAGQRVVYRGDISIVHDEGATRGRQQGPSDNATIFYARWGAMLEDDGPALGRIWGAGFGSPAPIPSGPGDIAVVGQPTGVGPAAAQVRAIVAGLEAIGRAPVTRDSATPIASALMGAAEWAPVQRALGRVAQPGIPMLAPDGVPAIVMPAGVGRGGGGTLVLAPAHDLACAERSLAAALDAGLPGPLAVLPSARTPALEALVAQRAPGAVIVDPTASDHVLAGRAAVADLVVALDPADPWDRAALVCAGAGAAVVTRPGGPADGLLGPGRQGLGEAERVARHRAVAAACAPERVLGGLAAGIAA